MDVVNEVSEFLDDRYVTAPEACWRLFELPMHACSHVVERLPVHLKDEQATIFPEGQERHVAAKKASTPTKLTAYFAVSK